ncbi:MAG: glycosyltransferase family 4 protein [Ideonella sp.]|nr:glycosyltransferase family 4 protein [Ideonella sp.]MCC7456878.1 glycosyltransferase family 4 protein [Nitrospira sp.]
MNLLLLNHYAGGPAFGMEYRPYYLAREWVRAGHRVQIVAGSYSHVRARQPEVTGRVRDETIDGIAYRWLATPAYSGNGAARARNIASFLGRLWAQAGALARDFAPDAVIASSTYPMDIWPARRIARLCAPRRAKLVYEIHDLWPLSPIELAGMSPTHPFARVCQRAENDAYRHADVVVSMLPKVHEHVAAHGLDLQRLAIVPNGIDPDEWQRAAEPLRDDVRAALDAARSGARLVVGYAGSMGLPNALDTLLDAARLLADEPFAFVLVGDGHERARLAQRVRQETIANVTLLPPIPKAQVPSFLSRLDVAAIGWQRVPIYRFGIAPNKLMDYMMAGCAVLHAVEAGNDPVADAGCGITVAPESAPVMADGLRRLATAGPEARRAMGERGRAHVLAHHSYPVLARRFVEALQR